MAADIACPACGASPASVARDVPYRSGEVLRCGKCGHCWISRTCASEADGVVVQLEHFGEEFAGRSDFFLGFYQEMNARRALGIAAPAKGASVLEIGPGSGHLMAALARRGCEVTGLDLSQAVADAIRARFGLTVLRKSIESFAARGGEGRFDLALLCHVVEHFPEPLRELRQVRRLLKDDARVYVSVPNMGSWHARYRGWNGYEPYHLHYFTAASLRRLFARAGFEIEREATWEGLTAWTNTMHRSLAGAGKHAGATAPGTRFGRRTVRRTLEIARLCIGIATTPVRWIQARLGVGEELILLARKA